MDAAAVRDVYLDVVVLISVLMFVALMTGIGMLALQQGNPSWMP
jgi:hypothetical protein